MSHLGTPWPMVVALYHQALPMQESDRIDFLQKHCGVRTPLYYEVRSLLAGARRVSTTLRQSAKEFSEYSFLENPMRRVC